MANDPETTELDTAALKAPGEKLDPATPIGDEVAKELKLDVPFSADSNDDDVKSALKRKTQDGKGDEEPGDSDWNGYATDEVETD